MYVYSKKLFDDMFGLTIKPFLVSEYLDRIEQEHLKIIEAKKKEPKYIITLWIGLDGLRMNEDETLEWVSRAKKESESPQDKVVTGRQSVPTPIYPSYIYQPRIYPSYLYQQPVFPIPWMNQPMQATTQWKGPIETAIQQQTQQILQSIQMQTAQIDNNIRIMEMMNSQQNCNQIHQIWLDKQQQI